MNKTTPNEISKEHFNLLVSLTSINSKRLKNALEDYFVNGVDKKSVCERFGVNSSYFSLKVKIIHEVSRTVISLYPFYHDLFSVKTDD